MQTQEMVDVIRQTKAAATAASEAMEQARVETHRLHNLVDFYRTENGKYERTMRAARDLLKADEFDTARDLIDAFLRGIDGPSE